MNDLRVRPRSRVLLTALADGSGVLLDLDTKFYFTLNPSSVRLWRELERRGGATAAELGSYLTTHYEVDLPTATSDAGTLLTELVQNGLADPAVP